MKHTFSFIAVVLIAIVFAAVEIPACRELDRRAGQYRVERATVEDLERAYRRPVLEQPLEQNAAPWYTRALPNLSTVRLTDLTPAIDAGAALYDPATKALMSAACAEIDGEAVRTALRCSSCDWRLGFDAQSINRFVPAREALTLARCLTIAGHRSGHRQELQAAARRYLEGLAVACDLGNGSTTMLVAAIGAATENLLALGRLATIANDDVFLRHAVADLAEFEPKLPDGRGPFLRERLWGQNTVALNQLESAGVPGLKLLRLNQVIGIRALGAEDALFGDAARLSQISRRTDGIQLAERLQADVAASGNDIVRSLNLPQAALVATNVVELTGIFHAVQAAIELQQWKLEHGTYPPDGSALSVDLTRDEIRYERSPAGQGYRLIGPRRTLIER
ncbi:MAG TPA: hypothetical protein VKH42_19705 [Vicinamibacterales bacterium]|nr:hypothetical protein [Vicinamibacterales bacterium]